MFDDIVRKWLLHSERRVDLAASTKVEYRRVAGTLLAFTCERDDANALLAYVEHRRAAGMAPRTIALELRVVSVVTHWATRTLEAPPPPVLPRVHVDANRFALNHRTPTPAEAAAALRAMQRDDWRLAARLIATTGARIGEVVHLRSVDVDEAAWRVAFGATEGASKTGMRWFPLDAASLRGLAGRLGRGREPLFDFGGVKAPIQGLQRCPQRACQVAGVPRFTPHGLRRMVIGRLLRAQVEPATAVALTGHSIEVMLKHYREVTDDDRRLAAERAMLGVLDDLPRDI